MTRAGTSRLGSASPLLFASLLVAALLALAACSSNEPAAAPDVSSGTVVAGNVSANGTDPFAVNLTLAARSVPANGSLRVLAPNGTGEVSIYRYCGMPGWLLKRDRGAYRYVFPVTDACASPENASFEGALEVPLASFPRDALEPLTPGDYEFKLFYSVLGPGDEMREANLYFTVVR